MTPGRSLLGKTSGRSSAPVASTTARARSVTALARASPLAGSGRRWPRRSTSATVCRHSGRDAVVRVRSATLRSGVQLPRRRRARLAGPARGSDSRRRRHRVVDQHHAGAAAAGGKSGRQACRAAADDQHVGEFVARLVAVGIGLEARLPQAGRATDERLVEHPGAAAGAHEGLVVEPGGEQRRGEGIDRPQIERDRGPGVLARRAKPVQPRSWSPECSARGGRPRPSVNSAFGSSTPALRGRAGDDT